MWNGFFFGRWKRYLEWPLSVQAEIHTQEILHKAKNTLEPFLGTKKRSSAQAKINLFRVGFWAFRHPSTADCDSDLILPWSACPTRVDREVVPRAWWNTKTFTLDRGWATAKTEWPSPASQLAWLKRTLDATASGEGHLSVSYPRKPTRYAFLFRPWKNRICGRMRSFPWKRLQINKLATYVNDSEETRNTTDFQWRKSALGLIYWPSYFE